MFKKFSLVVVALLFVFAAAIAACTVTPATAQDGTTTPEPTTSATAFTSPALFEVVLADGTHFAVTAELIATLPSASVTVNGDSFKGVLLSDVLAAAGVKDYNELVFTGSSVYTVKPERVSDRFILSLSKDRGTYEMQTPVVPLSNLVKDITTIEVK